MGLFYRKSEESIRDYDSEIREISETIDNAERQIELIKKEYDEVNSFLIDAQLIETLPPEAKEELQENAKQLVKLKKEMSKLSTREESSLTEFEFGIMERYEDILPEEIKRLKREEDYELAIKSDLKKLSGEKAVLEHEEDIEKNKRIFLSRMGVLSGTVIGLLLLMYFILYLVFETFASVAFLLTVTGGVFMVLYLFIRTDQNAKALKLNVAKMGKLIALTNIVKVKYVNQKASLDFTHDKYAVNSVLELEYKFNQYITFKNDEIKRRKSSSEYQVCNIRLKDILDEYKIHDSEVWANQINAIVDNREMVEIRHNLNERRQKIRDRLKENMDVVTRAKEKLIKIKEDGK